MWCRDTIVCEKPSYRGSPMTWVQEIGVKYAWAKRKKWKMCERTLVANRPEAILPLRLHGGK